MENKLREYMDMVFSDIEPSKKSIELKEEILQNLIDKYNDLLSEGKSPEAAYNIAVASIGDTSELLAGFRQGTVRKAESIDMAKAKKKTAILMAVAIALYITCVVPVIIFTFISENGFFGAVLGPCIMFVMIAVATGLIIYNEMTKPKYNKTDDTMVEEFKEWQDRNDSSVRAMKSIKSALWSLIVVMYLIVSFMTGAWHITWVIFLIGSAIEKIIQSIFELKRQ